MKKSKTIENKFKTSILFRLKELIFQSQDFIKSSHHVDGKKTDKTRKKDKKSLLTRVKLFINAWMGTIGKSEK